MMQEDLAISPCRQYLVGLADNMFNRISVHIVKLTMFLAEDAYFYICAQKKRILAFYNKKTDDASLIAIQLLLKIACFDNILLECFPIFDGLDFDWKLHNNEEVVCNIYLEYFLHIADLTNCLLHIA